MKKVSLLAVMLVAGVNADAMVSQYASTKVGFTQSNTASQVKGMKDTKTNRPAANFSVGYGLKLDDAVRTDVEFTYNTRAHKDASRTFNKSLMVNGYYDFAIMGSKFTPYAQVGLGFANVKDETSGIVSSKLIKNKFAWQVGTGVGYEVAPMVTVDAGYRFASFGKSEMNANTKVRHRTHSFTVGARFGF